MARNYAALPHEYLEEMEELSDEEFGRLIRGLISYSRSGEVISPSGNERFYVRRVMNQEDRFQENYGDISEKRSEAGRIGANKRWQNDGKNIANDSKNGNAILPLANDSKNGYTETKTKTNTKPIPIPPPTPPKGEAFDRFWAAYPKKTGKQAAYKAFVKIKGVSVETMIKAVEYQRSTEQWQKENGRFIPNPATWLNQGRWEDEVVQVPDRQDDPYGYRMPADLGDNDAIFAEMEGWK